MKIEKPSHINSVRQDGEDYECLVARLITHPHYGLSEKQDGHRVLVKSDGKQMVGYNGLAPMVISKINPRPLCPRPAAGLMVSGKSFLVDGEAIGGRGNWSHYIIFNILEWEGDDLTDWPQHDRDHFMTYQAEVFDIPISSSPRFQDGPLQFLSSTCVRGSKQLLYDDLKSRKPPVEGVIFRNMYAQTAIGRTTSILKYPFLCEMDVVGYRWNRAGAGTLKGGSVGAGFYHNGQFTHIANVRSGFSHSELDFMEDALDRGERPVFKVEFLGKRTVGRNLVQPRNKGIRDDKLPEGCISQQFFDLMGDERKRLFE